MIILAQTCFEQSRPAIFAILFKYTLLHVYYLFGPILLILSILALTKYQESLFYQCDAVYGFRVEGRPVNYRNVVQIVIAMIISLSVIFLFTLMFVISRTQVELRDENSMVCRLYYGALRLFMRRN